MRAAFLKRVLLAATLLVLLGLALPVPALAVTASGKVVMGTAGAPLPGDLRVTVLQNTDQGQPQGQPTHVPVAPDGSFTFDADPGNGHLIGLFYGGAAYSRVLEPGETDEIELKIFETTNDTSVVKIASDSMTILQSTSEGRSDVFEVLQLLRFHNDSDRSFVGTDPDAPAETEQPREVLKLPLPESAYDLAPADPGNGAGLATAGGRLVATSALVPGETSVAYMFKVKVPRSGWQLRREVYHPTDHADLLVDKNLKLAAAPGFQFAESKKLGEQEYNRYRSGPMNPGAVLQADIGFTGGGSPNGVWFGFVTVVAALGALFFAVSIRMRRRKAAYALGAAHAAPDGGEVQPDDSTREQLIEQVAALDERFDAGDLDQDAYRAQRSTLLARLSRPAENP